MPAKLEHWLWVFASPLIVFLLLIALTHLLYQKFFQHIKVSTITPLALMAITMVSIPCFAQFNVPRTLSKLFVIELIIIWLYLLGLMLHTYFADKLSLKLYQPSLIIGIWATTTNLPILFFIEVEPRLYGFILLLTFIALFLTLLSCGLFFSWWFQFFRKRNNKSQHGTILFSVINIQLLALTLFEIFSEDLPEAIYHIMILTGLSFYVLSLIALLLHNIGRHHWRFYHAPAASLVYCASSLSGLAMLTVGNFPILWAGVLWWYSLLMLILIETSNLIALLQYRKVWSKRFLQYQPLQWLHIFSLATFYAFTVAYQFPYVYSNLGQIIVEFGKYMLLFFLAWQLIRFMLLPTALVVHDQKFFD